ncbi:replication initiation factor domain-containing protein [Pseudoalteromonas sp. SG45-3]|uniref:replication initiation factor domain-containing protein n=1 Tax=Pseudoalteromonas sp. SG45-3 TaxID=2760955 RepID=UPI001602CBB5|nr:replication initiation factor domain-containing protein [Pseudoalteromonas sp. SG45-3]MBB1352364.1 replication initiation factor domain-containing protein [Pseudoalteromonas sp. SG45-3]
MHYKYSDTAQNLIDNRIKRFKKHEANQTIIDFLSFSFPLADLRHCKRAGSIGSTVDTQTLFPVVPNIKEEFNTEGLTPEQLLKSLETQKQRINERMSDFYINTLRVFSRYVLGFELSVPRDKGFHGYHNSMNLVTSEGTQIGFVGIGGQRDTVYFQISGEGCKHLWSHTTPFILHHWLSKVLSISSLSRIDIARDCFDNVFNCKAAELNFFQKAFARKKGGPNPTMSPRHSFTIDGKFDVEMTTVGKRTSPVYWRIYDKKLEQGIEDESLVWYRNEVELKKWSVDCLLDPDSTFAGICDFSQQMINTDGVQTSSSAKVSKAGIDLASRVKWVRRMCGKALADILEITEGNMQTVYGLLVPDKYVTGKSLDVPNIYKHILIEQLRAA